MKVEIDKKVLETLIEALEFYADPNTYWACGFMFDRPTGGFDDDFSDYNEFKDFCPDDHESDHGERMRPGLNARKALRQFDQDPVILPESE